MDINLRHVKQFYSDSQYWILWLIDNKYYHSINFVSSLYNLMGLEGPTGNSALIINHQLINYDEIVN